MDKPTEGKVYALTGGTGAPCIANGNTWAESEVRPEGYAGEDDGSTYGTLGEPTERNGGPQ